MRSAWDEPFEYGGRGHRPPPRPRYNRPTIQQVHVKRYDVEIKLDNAYTFRSDRPAHWLQRLCLWVLRKLKCFDIVRQSNLERHVFTETQMRAVDKAIHAQGLELIDAYGRMPKVIYIGSEEWAELTQNPIANWPVRLKMDGGSMTYSGVTIEVIPWMKGVLLV